MAKLLQLLGSIKGIFAQYAGKDGDGRSLSKKELGELLREEFGITGSVSGKTNHRHTRQLPPPFPVCILLLYLLQLYYISV